MDAVMPAPRIESQWLKLQSSLLPAFLVVGLVFNPHTPPCCWYSLQTKCNLGHSPAESTSVNFVVIYAFCSKCGYRNRCSGNQEGINRKTKVSWAAYNCPAEDRAEFCRLVLAAEASLPAQARAGQNSRARSRPTGRFGSRC